MSFIGFLLCIVFDYNMDPFSSSSCGSSWPRARFDLMTEQKAVRFSFSAFNVDAERRYGGV